MRELDKTFFMKTFGISFIILFGVFGGWGFGFIVKSYLFGLVFAVIGSMFLALTHLVGMTSAKILLQENKKKTRKK